jgi:hypothetical protein
MATAAELRQILKQDAAGKNLYDHLTETLLKILIDKPANSYDQFEIISSDVKAKPFNPDPEARRAVPPSEEEVRGTRSRDGRTCRRHRLSLTSALLPIVPHALCSTPKSSAGRRNAPRC